MICPFCRFKHDNKGDCFGCPNCEGKPMTSTAQPYKPANERAESFLHIRCRQSDKALWVKQAQREGKTLAQFVIDKLGRAK